MINVQTLEGKISPRTDKVARAIQMSRLLAESEAVYSSVIDRLAINLASSTGLSPKETLRRTRVLKSSGANLVLQMIWRESNFISDEVRAISGLQRKFEDGELNAYRIATLIAENPTDLAAVNSRVRSICMAAEQFGLIERIAHAQTRVSIRATKTLNDLMLVVARQQREIMSELVDAGPT